MLVKEVVFVVKFEFVESYLNSLSGNFFNYVEIICLFILNLNKDIYEYLVYGLLVYKVNGYICYIGGFINYVGIYGLILDVIKFYKEVL